MPGPILNNHFMSADLASSDPKLVEMYSKVSVSNERPHLHLALMYSNPLVDFSADEKHVIKNAHNMSDPVNFSVECNKIWDTIKKTNKNINVHIECATNKQFFEIVKRRPTILHMMCHGSLDKEFFLELENDNCELYRLTPSILRRELEGEDLSGIELVFINACHSEVGSN